MPIVPGTGGFDNTDHFGLITVQSNPATRLNKSVAAIAVRVTGAQLPSAAGVDNHILIKELYAEGSGRRHVTMQITDNDPPGANEVLASLAAAKLVNANVPYPILAHEHIGEASDVEARQYGTRFLLAGIDLASRKTWKIRADIPDTLHDKGETASVNGRLTTIDDWGIELDDNGAEVLTLITCDYSPPTGEAMY